MFSVYRFILYSVYLENRYVLKRTPKQKQKDIFQQKTSNKHNISRSHNDNMEKLTLFHNNIEIEIIGFICLQIV